MLNITLEEVKKYAKDYTAVPVTQEILADTLTPIGFISNVKNSRTAFKCGGKVYVQAGGGKVVLAPKLVHGKTSKIKIDTTCKLFSNMPKEIQGARYHSLIVAKENLPKELLITAETEQGEIMGLKHKDYNIYGVQFHPESIMTPDGKKIIENFLKITGGK